MQRRQRLRHASDFALLRREGRRYHHPLLVMVVRANGGAESRFGFSAGRQVGKATSRNRAKRLMRESVRNYRKRIPEGWDCLFIARRDSGNATLAQMCDAVEHTLTRAQLLNEDK